MESVLRALRLVILPLGYLAFVIGLAALSAAARLLGEKHELGFFSGRLAQAVWRYPELTRGGIQTAWLTWAALLVVAISPIDPLATRWDEVVLAALALAVVWRRLFAGRQAGR
jgi:hypothetical protein